MKFLAYHDDMETPESYALHAINSALDEAMEQRVTALERELEMRNSLIDTLRWEKTQIATTLRDLSNLLDERNEEIAFLQCDLKERNAEITDLYMQMSEE